MPVGDFLWVGRPKAGGPDYVLDFILERKRVDDLWSSIKQKRYEDQKRRLRVRGFLFLTPSRIRMCIHDLFFLYAVSR